MASDEGARPLLSSRPKPSGWASSNPARTSYKANIKVFAGEWKAVPSTLVTRMCKNKANQSDHETAKVLRCVMKEGIEEDEGEEQEKEDKEKEKTMDVVAAEDGVWDEELPFWMETRAEEKKEEQEEEDEEEEEEEEEKEEAAVAAMEEEDGNDDAVNQDAWYSGALTDGTPEVEPAEKEEAANCAVKNGGLCEDPVSHEAVESGALADIADDVAAVKAQNKKAKKWRQKQAKQQEKEAAKRAMYEELLAVAEWEKRQALEDAERGVLRAPHPKAKAAPKRIAGGFSTKVSCQTCGWSAVTMKMHAVWTKEREQLTSNDPPDLWSVLHFCFPCIAKEENKTVREVQMERRGPVFIKREWRAALGPY